MPGRKSETPCRRATTQGCRVAPSLNRACAKAAVRAELGVSLMCLEPSTQRRFRLRLLQAPCALCPQSQRACSPPRHAEASSWRWPPRSDGQYKLQVDSLDTCESSAKSLIKLCDIRPASVSSPQGPASQGPGIPYQKPVAPLRFPEAAAHEAENAWVRLSPKLCLRPDNMFRLENPPYALRPQPAMPSPAAMSEWNRRR